MKQLKPEYSKYILPRKIKIADLPPSIQESIELYKKKKAANPYDESLHELDAEILEDIIEYWENDDEPDTEETEQPFPFAPEDYLEEPKLEEPEEAQPQPEPLRPVTVQPAPISAPAKPQPSNLPPVQVNIKPGYYTKAQLRSNGYTGKLPLFSSVEHQGIKVSFDLITGKYKVK